MCHWNVTGNISYLSLRLSTFYYESFRFLAVAWQWQGQSVWMGTIWLHFIWYATHNTVAPAAIFTLIHWVGCPQYFVTKRKRRIDADTSIDAAEHDEREWKHWKSNKWNESLADGIISVSIQSVCNVFAEILRHSYGIIERWECQYIRCIWQMAKLSFAYTLTPSLSLSSFFSFAFATSNARKLPKQRIIKSITHWNAIEWVQQRQNSNYD